MQGILVCDSICHRLTGKLTSSSFIYSDVLNQIDKSKQTSNLCLVKLQFHISRKKLEPEPGSEPWTSKPLPRHSTI